MRVNHIDISGMIKTLPKDREINNTLYCEFLLSATFIFKHGGDIRHEFQVPVIAFRKYAKKCTLAYNTGKSIRVTGGLSWQCITDKLYNGFYISADTVKII